ncbi:tripartite tricarboxylate transporter TctB family protein [Paenibacillus cisolokensis]|nr:tripartite tricarboxylate transporter TctB family protein [Paenibacillus cisolokensis]
MMNRTVIRARMIAALLFMLAGLLTLWQSRGLRFGTLNHIQAGFFPVVFGGLLTVLSILMLAGLLLTLRRGRAADRETNGHEPVFSRGSLAILGVFILFVVLTYGFGFLLSSFITLWAIGYLLGLRSWRLMMLALFTTASIWLIFDWWLGIYLPPGVWI